MSLAQTEFLIALFNDRLWQGGKKLRRNSHDGRCVVSCLDGIEGLLSEWERGIVLRNDINVLFQF